MVRQAMPQGDGRFGASPSRSEFRLQGKRFPASTPTCGWRSDSAMLRGTGVRVPSGERPKRSYSRCTSGRKKAMKYRYLPRGTFIIQFDLKQAFLFLQIAERADVRDREGNLVLS